METQTSAAAAEKLHCLPLPPKRLINDVGETSSSRKLLSDTGDCWRPYACRSQPPFGPAERRRPDHQFVRSRRCSSQIPLLSELAPGNEDRCSRLLCDQAIPTAGAQRFRAGVVFAAVAPRRRIPFLDKRHSSSAPFTLRRARIGSKKPIRRSAAMRRSVFDLVKFNCRRTNSADTTPSKPAFRNNARIFSSGTPSISSVVWISTGRSLCLVRVAQTMGDHSFEKIPEKSTDGQG